jgi:lipopolysaccharide/colanic/teichoic acid biosynthesis glycosyltransferase
MRLKVAMGGLRHLGPAAPATPGSIPHGRTGREAQVDLDLPGKPGADCQLSKLTLLRDRCRCYLRFKRTFDIINAVLQLVLFAPIMLLAALAIKLYDGGPVLFSQRRITGGPRGPREFNIYKFRTMVIDAERHGAKITPKNDGRITPVGRVLRKLKIDEMPQLLNILRGEMSFVGPRPQTLGYVERFREHYQLIHSVVPSGLTDLASVRYRNEEEELAGADDPEALYVNRIMPEKIKLHHEYVQRMSLLLDLRILYLTLVSVYGR